MTEEELEVIFGQGLAEEAGDIVPLPSMPLLHAAPGADDPSVAQAVEQGRQRQRETREVAKVSSELDDLMLGDEVDLPGGIIGVISWIDPRRKRIAIGQGRNKTFFSLTKIEKLSGRRVASDIKKQREQGNREEGMREPEPKVEPQLPSNLPEGLFPHQVENVEFLWRRGRGLIADEPGLGKTLCACVTTVAPAVVVCPALLKVNWAREYAMWMPDLSVAIISGTKAAKIDEEQREADVVIINYDIIHSHVDWLIGRNNQTLIADEAHYLKNLDVRWNKPARRHEPAKGSPRRAKAFYELQGHIPRLSLLTGTPILNRTKELFPLLHMLDKETWGSGYQFCMRYCAGHYEFLRVRGGSRKVFNCNGRSNSDELHERINGIYMMRHTKEAELKNLPQKWRQSKTVSLSPQYAKLYRRARNDFLRWVAEKGGPDAVSKALRAEALVQLTKLRAIAAAGKAAQVTSDILEHWEGTQRPLVVMGVHRDAFDLIAAGIDKANQEHESAVAAGRMPTLSRPLRYGMIVGGMGASARQSVIDRFQVEGSLDLILYSIPLATGTTLTRSSEMYFLERMWRPADQIQAEDRIHRVGATAEKVVITYYDAEGTIDLKLGQMLVDKTVTAAAVIDGVDLSVEESSGLVFGEMFDLIEGAELKPNVRLEEPEGIRVSLLEEPAVFDAQGERFDAYDFEELQMNPEDDVYEEFIEGGWIADSWGDPL